MFATILKKGSDKFMIIDPYYRGQWESDKKALLVYLELIELLRKNKTRKFEKVYNSLLAICGKNYGYGEEYVKDILEFVSQNKLPIRSIFSPKKVIGQLDQYKEGIITPPTPIIEVTGKCNYRCPWCYVPTRDYEAEMSIDIIRKNLVEPFVEFGLTSWCLSGGEPSLELDRTLEIASMIKNECVNKLEIVPEIYLLTNGYKLKEHARLYREAGITAIQVALTSSEPEVEIALRCPPKGVNSFISAVEGLKEIKKEGLVTEVNMILQPKNGDNINNLNTIEGMFDLANDIMVDVLRIIPAVPTGKAKENGINFSQGDYNEIRKIMSGIRSRELKNPKMIIDCPVDQPVDENCAVYCRAGTLFFYINYAGHVFPCNNLQAKEAECWDGTVKQTDVVEIWTKSKLLNEFRDVENASLAEECIGCSYRAECVGECRAICWARYGQFDLKVRPKDCYKEAVNA
ncbi:radical SAM protein with 4Fe4S-binding SPASM domain [Anaerobacterium chartisolvens]|uniref:Radical SAM protein with 4Fe4S-binding SPASM domain n=1 Tax=Anaerobacterium chartisolvens TaxID=1297424 RepID=A0A369AT27_9FIRM|nr:radical SAM protein [Anaerobacterium chartisolvens]RCX12499.1 radical SAM protein with 4Fe4S-binding SPASM domain [Anaerobacterium chartisolvens]